MYLPKAIATHADPELAGIDFDTLLDEVVGAVSGASFGITTSAIDEHLTPAGRATIRAKSGSKPATPTKLEATAEAEAASNNSSDRLDTRAKEKFQEDRRRS